MRFRWIAKPKADLTPRALTAAFPVLAERQMARVGAAYIQTEFSEILRSRDGPGAVAIGASIETTLELWASSLRDVKKRMRSLFAQERKAANAGLFIDGLLGEERRKTGWMRAELRAILVSGASRNFWVERS
jgi:hypothetical protein